jgi:hypothetical protein
VAAVSGNVTTWSLTAAEAAAMGARHGYLAIVNPGDDGTAAFRVVTEVL